jgi:hypothetical protein
MVGKTLHLDFAMTFNFRYEDLQPRLVVGMENPSGDERVSYEVPPGYQYLSQRDKVSLLV